MAFLMDAWCRSWAQLLIDHLWTFSSVTSEFVVGHVVSEAQVGGFTALAEDGNDLIINSESKKLKANVCEVLLAQLKAN